MASDNDQEKRDQTTLEERAIKALRAFPMPDQASPSNQNYRRVLDWLYGSYPDVATLIIDLGKSA